MDIACPCWHSYIPFVIKRFLISILYNVWSKPSYLIRRASRKISRIWEKIYDINILLFVIKRYRFKQFASQKVKQMTKSMNALKLNLQHVFVLLILYFAYMMILAFFLNIRNQVDEMVFMWIDYWKESYIKMVVLIID